MEDHPSDVAMTTRLREFSTALRFVNDGVIMTGTDGRISFMNSAAEMLTGCFFSAAKGKKIGEMVTFMKEDILEVCENPVNKILSSSEQVLPIPSGFLLCDKKNNKIPIKGTTARILMDDGTLIGVVLVFQDRCDAEKNQNKSVREINAVKTLEAKIQQSQKMEAIGSLAGGIAHDFNNILTSIMGFTELALFKMQPDSVVENHLHAVYNSGKRAQELVKQILSFSRQDKGDLKPIQPSLSLKGILKLLRPSLPSTIAIRSNIATTSLVMGNQVQMHRVVMNLCTNAAYAMEKSGGELTINLCDTRIETSLHDQYPGLEPGMYMKLDISDTGTGISKEHLGMIFEPYFTTKPEGKGTGMGLSIVHGVIKKMQGDIFVHSELGKGTTFTLFVPLLEHVEHQKRPFIESIPTGTERILFVDDEPTIVDMSKQRLERFGYRVDVRTSSIEALEMFKQRSADFDLVITDLTMPHLTGDKLAKELQQIKPGIPVILCTGYSNHISDERARRLGIKALVMKPATQESLLRTMRQVLDAARIMKDTC